MNLKRRIRTDSLNDFVYLLDVSFYLTIV